MMQEMPSGEKIVMPGPFATTIRVFFLIGGAIEHGDVVLAPHHHPHFPAVGREEHLMRRAPDIRDVLDGVGRGIDEIHGIRADRDHGKGAMIGQPKPCPNNWPR